MWELDDTGGGGGGWMIQGRGVRVGVQAKHMPRALGYCEVEDTGEDKVHDDTGGRVKGYASPDGLMAPARQRARVELAVDF
jgi:hypothetical protein